MTVLFFVSYFRVRSVIPMYINEKVINNTRLCDHIVRLLDHYLQNKNNWVIYN
jgi:hypothetical protein